MDSNPINFTKDSFLSQFGEGGHWPVSVTSERIGGRWKPSIIFLVAMGINRFGELSRFIPNVSKTTLTNQLRELERDGILHRAVFAEVPPRVEYALTELGQTTLPVLKAMCAWGQMQMALSQNVQ